MARHTHTFYQPLAGRQAPKLKGESRPLELPEKDFLPKLNELADRDLIVVTARQFSALSTLATGSVSFRLASDGLKPAIEGSNVFYAGDVRRFCERHAAETAARLKQACLALGLPRRPFPAVTWRFCGAGGCGFGPLRLLQRTPS